MPASAVISIKPPAVFKVDRSFMFFVKDNANEGAALFVGSIGDI